MRDLQRAGTNQTAAKCLFMMVRYLFLLFLNWCLLRILFVGMQFAAVWLVPTAWKGRWLANKTVELNLLK
jgi:hypothetical protein